MCIKTHICNIIHVCERDVNNLIIRWQVNEVISFSFFVCARHFCNKISFNPSYGLPLPLIC